MLDFLRGLNAGRVYDSVRIFALTGPDGERATAQYGLVKSPVDGKPVYVLAELRGPGNAEASPECERIAIELAQELDGPAYAERRQAIAEGLSSASAKIHHARPPLDPESEGMVAALLHALGHRGDA